MLKLEEAKFEAEKSHSHASASESAEVAQRPCTIGSLESGPGPGSCSCGAYRIRASEAPNVAFLFQ
jgi:hypothetical protein